MNNKIEFEIVRQIGVLSENDKGWKKELNVVKWGESGPKYDIRSWNESHKRMGKGVTLTKEEIIELKNTLNKFES